MTLKTRCLHTASAREKGMTLAEVLVALGVASLVFMVIAMSFTIANRSFAAMGNYVDLDRTSRQVLDQMTRDIRKSKDLISFSTNRLELNYSGSNSLVYAWDSSTGTLTKWQTGDAQPTRLLTGCSSFAFSLYKKIPSIGGGYPQATLVSEAKAVGVAWKCSRTVLGPMVNTEDMQQAIIVIRNKPVS